jgi:hypothetical protein
MSHWVTEPLPQPCNERGIGDTDAKIGLQRIQPEIEQNAVTVFGAQRIGVPAQLRQRMESCRQANARDAAWRHELRKT